MPENLPYGQAYKPWFWIYRGSSVFLSCQAREGANRPVDGCSAPTGAKRRQVLVACRYIFFHSVLILRNHNLLLHILRSAFGMAHIGLPPSPLDTYPKIGKYHYHEAGSSHKVTTSLHWIRQLPLMPSQGTAPVFPDLDLHPQQISQNSGSRQAYHRAAAKQLICSSRPAGSQYSVVKEHWIV